MKRATFTIIGVLPFFLLWFCWQCCGTPPSRVVHIHPLPPEVSSTSPQVLPLGHPGCMALGVFLFSLDPALVRFIELNLLYYINIKKLHIYRGIP